MFTFVCLLVCMFLLTFYTNVCVWGSFFVVACLQICIRNI